jgi:hypothetical protein
LQVHYNKKNTKFYKKNILNKINIILTISKFKLIQDINESKMNIFSSNEIIHTYIHIILKILQLYKLLII